MLPFVLTLFFLYFAFKDTEFENIVNALSNVSILGTLAFISIFLLSHYLRALRAKYIIKSIKPDVKMTNIFASVMVGYGVNCVIPRLGEIYRPLFLGKWEGMHRTSVLGTIVVERVIDLLSLGFSILISVMIYSGDLYAEIDWLKELIYFFFLSLIIGILILYLIVRYKEKFYKGIIFFVSRISENIASKLADIFQKLIEGFSCLKGTKNIIMTIFYSAAIMFAYGFNSYVGFYMLRMDEIQTVTLGMGWVLMTIGAFGIIIPTPGGTGSYHFIMTSVLVGLYGFSNDIAGAYALLTHFISYVFFIGIMMISVQFVNKQRKKAGYKKETFISVFKLNKEQE